jgi:serine/threonine protein kinase
MESERLPRHLKEKICYDNFFHHYDLSNDYLGTGYHGKVMVCTDRQTNEEFAVKVIPCDPLSLSSLELHLSLCGNPGILDIVRVFCNKFETSNCPFSYANPKLKDGVHLLLVMPVMVCGDLHDQISMAMSEQVIASIFKKIAHAVALLHSKGIAHGDIKAENVLLGKNQDVVLCDFDASHDASKPPPLRIYTKHYVSPEVLGNLERKKWGFPLKTVGVSSDVWALGVLLYELVYLKEPFFTMPHEDDGPASRFVWSIKRGVYSLPPSFNASIEVRDLICSMLIPDPELRITMERVVKHPFVTTAV